MKRTIFASIFTLVFTTLAIGQLSLRPQIGINFPKFTEEISQGEFEGNAGYQFGVDLQVGGTFYIQPGLNFQSQKLTLKDVGDIDVSRINVPILAGYKFFESDGQRALGIRVFAGPNFAFTANEDLDEAFVGIDEDRIEDFLLSGLVGAGADIGILFVDVAYKFGLSKFFDDEVSDGSVNLFLVNAGIRLGF